MEKFNPSDYEKISDMPKGMQGRFREVPEGGFVRASVEDGPTRTIESGDKFVDRFTSYFKERREKLADRAIEDQMAVIHEEAMLMDSETSRRVNEILARGDSVLMELATEYQEVELERDEAIKVLNEYRLEQSTRRQSKIDQITKESQDKITQMGHTGELSRNYCTEDACKGEVIGVIDGKSIDLHWNSRGVGGSVDGQSVSSEVAQALLNKFRDVSVDAVVIDKIRKGFYRDEDYEGRNWYEEDDLVKKVGEIESRLRGISQRMIGISHREEDSLKSVEMGEKGDKIASSLLK